uniref:Solute carrier family 2 member 15b n=1 Tax=Oryzias sinensis TaxID=183150 RepID=A0A8C7YR71_9TELE
MAEELISENAGKTSGHLTKSLLAVAFLSSFGSSMLYGYNLAVVNSPAQYIKAFYNETLFERHDRTPDDHLLTVLYSVTVSIFAIGGMTGALLVGRLVTKYGRKGTLVRSTMLVFVGGALMGFSRWFRNPAMVITGRFITGVHSGTSALFLRRTYSIKSERLLFLTQEEHWPLLLALVVFPTAVQLMLLPWFPESPRYLLIEKGNIHATIAALKWFRSKGDIQAEIEEMQEEQRSLSSIQTLSVGRLLMDSCVRWQVITIVVVNIGMQLSGIDAIWFYTNDIFRNAGIPEPHIQYTTVGTGAIEVIAGMLGCFTIERVGRRPLIIGGFLFMGICCAGITVSVLHQAQIPFMSYISVGCVIGIIAGFCIGPAGVPFLITAELFKQSHRPSAYTVAGCLNWLSNFTIGFVFPFLQEATGPYCYLIFCAICFGVAIYAIFIIPETKNKTFLEISQMFASRNKIPSEELASNGHLKMALMNGYGTLVFKHRKTER